jgi:putative membrane protein
MKKQERTLSDYAGIAGVGVAMGAADVVPGVSGGTMAFILGIYDELLSSIKSFNLELVKLLLKGRFRDGLEHVNWRFLVSLGCGLGGTIVSLAHVITWLLDHHPVLLFSFFFGLVLASIVSVSTHVHWNPAMFATCALGAWGAYQIVRLVPMDMPNDPFTLFWSGAIAIMAMILPGISGSFLLFILGQYRFVLEAVKRFDVLTLIPFVLGIAIGIMAFSRVLTWLLHHYRRVTITLLVGFMIGSLWKIWPFRVVLESATNPKGEVVPIREAVVWPDVASGQFWFALLLCVLGFVIITVLDNLQSKANPIQRIVEEPKD